MPKRKQPVLYAAERRALREELERAGALVRDGERGALQARWPSGLYQEIRNADDMARFLGVGTGRPAASQRKPEPMIQAELPKGGERG